MEKSLIAKKRICYKTIGNCEMACKHTKDINYARNFRKMRPEIKESGFGEKDLRSEYVQTAESEKRKQFSMSG